jgi:hypothetical protein
MDGAALLVDAAAVAYDPSMTTQGSARGRYGEKLTDGLLESPAAERNKEAILEAIRSRLPSAGVVLEIASGTAQHVVHFARALPSLTWQPTDADEELRAAAIERIRAAASSNIRAPLHLDVLVPNWPSVEADAIICINMIHIAPWSATNALFAGGSRLLRRGAPLFLYGPFKRGGRHTAPSNAAFDESLRARNSEWGVRDLDDVERCAEEHGFKLVEVTTMPANNLTVAFERVPRTRPGR